MGDDVTEIKVEEIKEVIKKKKDDDEDDQLLSQQSLHYLSFEFSERFILQKMPFESVKQFY